MNPLPQADLDRISDAKVDNAKTADARRQSAPSAIESVHLALRERIVAGELRSGERPARGEAARGVRGQHLDDARGAVTSAQRCVGDGREPARLSGAADVVAGLSRHHRGARDHRDDRRARLVGTARRNVGVEPGGRLPPARPRGGPADRRGRGGAASPVERAQRRLPRRFGGQLQERLADRFSPDAAPPVPPLPRAGAGARPGPPRRAHRAPGPSSRPRSPAATPMPASRRSARTCGARWRRCCPR